MTTCCPLNVSFSTDYLRKVKYSQEVMHIIIWVLCHHLNHTVQYSTNHATKPTCIWSKEQDQTLVKGTDNKIKLGASFLIWFENLCLHVNLKWCGSLDQITVTKIFLYFSCKISIYWMLTIQENQILLLFQNFSSFTWEFLPWPFLEQKWNIWLHFNHFNTHTNSSWRFSGQKDYN